MAQNNPNRDGRPSTTTGVASIAAVPSFPSTRYASQTGGFLGYSVPLLHGSFDTPQDAVTPQKQSVFSHSL